MMRPRRRFMASAARMNGAAGIVATTGHGLVDRHAEHPEKSSSALRLYCVREAWQPLAGAALSAYAATVVSFLGAIHWGFGIRQAQPAASLFLWGIMPSLAAWAALLLPVGSALALHTAIAMLCWCLVVDRTVYPDQGAAAGLALRKWLSVVAILCCLPASLMLTGHAQLAHLAVAPCLLSCAPWRNSPCRPRFPSWRLQGLPSRESSPTCLLPGPCSARRNAR